MRKSKLIYVVLSALGLLLVAAYLFISFFSAPLIASYLQDKVGEEVRVNLIRASIGLFSQKIKLSGLTITYEVSSEQMQDISIQTIEIRGIKFRKLLQEGQLQCAFLLIERPNFDLSWDNLEEELEQDVDYRLPKPLEKISENSFIRAGEIKQMGLKLQAETETGLIQQRMDMDILFRDAVANEDGRSIGFFEIRVKDYELDLPDGAHRLKAGEARLNTKEQRIEGFDLSLSPTPAAREQGLGRYDIRIPTLSLRADILEVLRSRSLDFDSLIVYDADFKIINEFQAPISVAVSDEDFNPYALIEGLFERFSVNHLALERAKAAYVRSDEEREPRLSAEDINILMEGFLLDGTSAYNLDRILLSEQVSGGLSKLRVALNDSIHIVQAEMLKISSEDRLFTAEGITIAPNPKLMPKDAESAPFQYFTLNLPSLDLSGANMIEMINSRVFSTEALNISNPELFLSLKSSIGGNANDQEALDVYPFVKDFFNYIQIEQLDIVEGSFMLTNERVGGVDTVSINRLGLGLYGVQIDSLTAQKTQNKIFYAENVILDLSGYTLSLADGVHTLSASELFLSTFDSLIRLESVRLRPTNPLARANDNRYTLFDLSIPHLSLEGITIKEAFYNENISVKNIFAQAPILQTISYNYTARTRDPEDRNPILSLEGAEELLAQYFTQLDIDHVELAGGQLKSTMYQPEERKWDTQSLLNASISELQYTPQLGLTAANTQMALADFSLALPDKTHTIEADAILFDWLEARLQVAFLRVKSDSNSLQNTLVKLSADSLILQNYQPTKETFFIAETGPLEIYRPIVNLSLNKLKPELDITNIELPEVLAPVIQVNGWLIQNGHLSINFKDEAGVSSFETDLQWVGDTTLVLGAEKDYGLKAVQNTRFVQLDDIKFQSAADELSIALAGLNYRRTNGRLEARAFFLAKNDEDTPEGKTNLRVQGLILEQFEPDIFYLKKELVVERLSLQGPTLSLPGLQLGQEIGNEGIKANDLGGISLRIGTLNLSDGLLKFRNPKNDTISISGLSGTLKGIDLSEQITQDFLSGTQVLRFDGIKLLDQEGIYAFSSGPITIDREKGKAVIQKLEILPTLEEAAFFEKVKVAKDYLSMVSDSLVLRGIDYDGLLEGKAWIASHAELYGWRIDDVKDRNWPEEEGKKPPFPVELLLGLDKPLHLDTLRLHKGYVSYTEIPEGTDLRGQLWFEDVEAMLLNVTNISDSIAIDNRLKMRAQGSIMGKGHLAINFNTFLDDESYSFSLDGSLREMALNAFNPILRPITFIEVVDGELNRMDFAFEADKRIALGRLRMDYRDLRVAVLDENSPNLEKEKAFTSFLANTFIIRNRSSRRIGQAKWQAIEEERNEERSIFNYWWKSILSGVKPALGLKN